MDTRSYRQWYLRARRLARSAAEADDVLHDSLLAAVAAGRGDLVTDADRRWFAGTLANQAAMRVRTEIRRRRHEAGHSPTIATGGQPVMAQSSHPVIRQLPRGLRRVLALVLHGFDRAEIRDVLAISDVALRQRLSALRTALGSTPISTVTAIRDGAGSSWCGHCNPGLLRRSLVVALRRWRGIDPAQKERTIGCTDPDGHLFIVGPDLATSHFALRRQLV